MLGVNKLAFLRKNSSVSHPEEHLALLSLTLKKSTKSLIYKTNTEVSLKSECPHSSYFHHTGRFWTKYSLMKPQSIIIFAF